MVTGATRQSDALCLPQYNIITRDTYTFRSINSCWFISYNLGLDQSNMSKLQDIMLLL